MESRNERFSKGRQRGKSAEELAKLEKTLELEKFLAECGKIIKEYNLEAVVTKVKSTSPERSEGPQSGKFNCVALLEGTERSCFLMGMIKLGEAMTFCKNSEEEIIKNSGIKTYAGNYTELRNYIIHHYMYDQSLERYEELNTLVEAIPFINNLIEKLIVLEKAEGIVLKKYAGESKGDNFKFEYDHFIACLEHEFLTLEEKFNQAKQMEKFLLI